MGMGAWGAMAGLGQGMAQASQYLFDDVKQQKLNQWRSAEADKDRKFSAKENQLNRDQRSSEFGQTFEADERVRGAQLEMMETQLKEANIQLGEIEQYSNARSAYLNAPDEAARDDAWDNLERILVSTGKIEQAGFQLVKLKQADELGGETEVPYLFNSRTGSLVPAGRRGGEEITADQIRFVMDNLDDEEVLNDFMSATGIDPRSFGGRGQKSTMGKLWDGYWGVVTGGTGRSVAAARGLYSIAGPAQLNAGAGGSSGESSNRTARSVFGQIAGSQSRP